MKPALTFFGLSLLISPLVAAEPSGRDDAGRLRQNGSLIFQDTFDREEEGNGMRAIGNVWERATADRAPNIKQADLDQGILNIASDGKAASAVAWAAPSRALRRECENGMRSGPSAWRISEVGETP